MSSRIDATAGCIRSASPHSENCTSEGIKGVMRASRRGIWRFSSKLNSPPPRRNGTLSNDKAIAASHLSMMLPWGPCNKTPQYTCRWVGLHSRYGQLADQPMQPQLAEPPPKFDHLSQATKMGV